VVGCGGGGGGGGVELKLRIDRHISTLEICIFRVTQLITSYLTDSFRFMSYTVNILKRNTIVFSTDIAQCNSVNAKRQTKLYDIERCHNPDKATF